MLDMISTAGFAVGLLAAIAFAELRQEPFRHWFPFILFSLSFALFGVDGGVLDPLPPGQTRLLALIVVLFIEIGTVYLIRYPLSTSKAY